MPIWVEALLGAFAITAVILACWYEDKLVEFEDWMMFKVRQRWENRKEKNTTSV